MREGSQSSYTVATFFTKEYGVTPTLMLMDQSSPVSADQNILGIVVNCGFTFRQHTQDINAEAKSKLNATSGCVFNISQTLKSLWRRCANNLPFPFSRMPVLPGIATWLNLSCRCCIPLGLCIAYSFRLYQVDYHGPPPCRDKSPSLGEVRKSDRYADISVTAASEYPLHEGLHNLLDVERRMHATSSSQNTPDTCYDYPSPV